MQIKIFLDGADIESMIALADKVSGYTTNPSICRTAGVTDYRVFAKNAITAANDKPISLEVFADDMAGMERQAQDIASWGGNVYVKIPITNTAGGTPAGSIQPPHANR